MNLIATFWPISLCVAETTNPIAPLPRTSSTTYLSATTVPAGIFGTSFFRDLRLLDMLLEHRTLSRSLSRDAKASGDGDASDLDGARGGSAVGELSHDGERGLRAGDGPGEHGEDVR